MSKTEEDLDKSSGDDAVDQLTASTDDETPGPDTGEIEALDAALVDSLDEYVSGSGDAPESGDDDSGSLTFGIAEAEDAVQSSTHADDLADDSAADDAAADDVVDAPELEDTLDEAEAEAEAGERDGPDLFVEDDYDDVVVDDDATFEVPAIVALVTDDDDQHSDQLDRADHDRADQDRADHDEVQDGDDELVAGGSDDADGDDGAVALVDAEQHDDAESEGGTAADDEAADSGDAKRDAGPTLPPVSHGIIDELRRANIDGPVVDVAPQDDTTGGTRRRPKKPIDYDPAPIPVPLQVPRILGRKPRVRKVTRVVRHVDPWSVFKIALLANLVLYGIILTASVLLWNVAYATGTIANVERFFESFGWQSFEFNGGELYNAAWVAGLFIVLGLTGLWVLLATLFNLITDVVGGVRFTVLEEEVVEARTSPMRRFVVRRPEPEVPAVISDASGPVIREAVVDDSGAIER